jgi:hypothetical protein
MKRVQRFIANAGAAGFARSLVVLIIIYFAMRKDFATGLWHFTFPCLILCFFLSFPFRHQLVLRFQVTRIALNVIAVIGFVILLFTGRHVSEPAYLRILLSLFIGLYMGIYFWLLSDPMVSREE